MKIRSTIKFFLVIILLQLQSFNLKAQNPISLKIKNKTLQEVLTEIEKKSTYTFVYSSSEIDVHVIINYKTRNADIKKILEDILTKNNIEYKIFDQQIVLRKKANAAFRSIKEIQGLVISKTDSFFHYIHL